MRFVSAFLDLNEDRTKEKSVEKYLELLHQLIETGIQLHLFISPKYANQIPYASENFFVEFIDLEDLEIFKFASGSVSKEISLPPQRNTGKDTANYMILMNAKAEFVHRSMQRFREETTFAWIDSGIFHVFRQPAETTKYLQSLSEKSFESPCLLFPGAWEKGYALDRLFTQINWRFLGGFFCGHRDALENLWKIYKEHFQQIIETNCLTWEVNIWAYFESQLELPLTWFKADHNDSIVKIPCATEGIN